MTIDEAIVAVADFLQPLMPVATTIVRGQTNDVPPPLPPSIVITEVGKPQYTTIRVTGGGAFIQQDTYLQPVRLDVQLDFYGLQAGDMSGIANTMLRSGYAVENFPDGVAPLYCSDAIQAPLITGEKQFEARWIITLSLQYNASVTVGQESFIEVGDVMVDPVDQTTPTE